MRFLSYLMLFMLLASFTPLNMAEGYEEDLRPFCPLKTIIMTKHGPKALVIYGENAAKMDVDASQLIADYIQSIGGEAPVLNASKLTQLDLAHNHLIVVGGPVANELSRTVNETSRFSMFLREDGWYLRVNYTPGGTWGGKFEVGVVGAMPNPWNENYTLIYVAGINRYATFVSALKLIELGGSANYWAVVVLNRYGQPLPLREYRIYKLPPAPPELSFLNITEKGSVPQGVTRVWIIAHEESRWYVIRGASDGEYPLMNEYNAFYLEMSVNQSRSLGKGDNISIFLGVYSSRLSFELEAPEPWQHASIRYNPLYSNFTLFVEGAFLEKDELVPIPWTDNKAFIRIETMEQDGRFELVVFEYVGDVLLGTELVRLNLTRERAGSFQISPGPDLRPTQVGFYVSDFSLASKWAKIDLRIDFGPQADRSLNLTDLNEVGDDINPWEDLGYLIQYQEMKLWLIKSERVWVPYCEGLLRNSSVDPYLWTECKPYILGANDWLVATLPRSGD